MPVPTPPFDPAVFDDAAAPVPADEADVERLARDAGTVLVRVRNTGPRRGFLVREDTPA